MLILPFLLRFHLVLTIPVCEGSEGRENKHKPRLLPTAVANLTYTHHDMAPFIWPCAPSSANTLTPCWTHPYSIWCHGRTKDNYPFLVLLVVILLVCFRWTAQKWRGQPYNSESKKQISLLGHRKTSLKSWGLLARRNPYPFYFQEACSFPLLRGCLASLWSNSDDQLPPKQLITT